MRQRTSSGTVSRVWQIWTSILISRITWNLTSLTPCVLATLQRQPLCADVTVYVGSNVLSAKRRSWQARAQSNACLFILVATLRDTCPAAALLDENVLPSVVRSRRKPPSAKSKLKMYSSSSDRPLASAEMPKNRVCSVARRLCHGEPRCEQINWSPKCYHRADWCTSLCRSNVTKRDTQISRTP